MMKRLLCASVALALAGPAFAQSSAANSTIGYLSSSNHSCGQTTCFVPYGATVPVSGSFSGTSDVNVKQVNGITVLTGTGATGTGAQRVTVSVDSATVAGSATLPAGTAVIGKVGIDQTTPGTTNAVQPVGGATGGISVSSNIVANNTTSVAIDASPGTLYGVTVFNNSATIAYLKIYNAAQGSTTCGSGTPSQRIMIPASTSGAGAVIPFPVGIAYSTAITSCVTTGIADNDTGTPAASAYLTAFYYK